MLHQAGAAGLREHGSFVVVARLDRRTVVEDPTYVCCSPGGSRRACAYPARVALVIEEFEPAPPLRGIIDRAADYHERGAPLRRLESPFVGIVLIVSLGPDFEVDGRATGSFVAGLWDRPTLTGHYGEQAGYQLYLNPLEAPRLLGVPVSELANRLVSLEDVVGSLATELTERLADAADARERDAVAQRLFASRRASDRSAPPEVEYALARLRATQGAARVESLAAEVGWSRRHLSSRFRDALGLSPKALARVIRVEHAAHRVRTGEPLADVAYAAGYADQAHFNRDFRELVGCTPGQFPFVQDTLVAA